MQVYEKKFRCFEDRVARFVQFNHNNVQWSLQRYTATAHLPDKMATETTIGLT